MFQKAFSAAFALAALSGCLSGGDNGASPRPVSGKLFTSGNYAVQGDRLVVSGFMDTVSDCNGDTLFSYVNITPEESMPFTIKGDTLTLVKSMDTSLFGAVVEHSQRLFRTGGAEGLEGRWHGGDRSYRVVSGTLTSDETAEYDHQLARERFEDSFEEVDYEFASGIIRVEKDVKTAERILARWTGDDPRFDEPADSLRYDVDVSLVDKYTVEYRGRQTSERLRITELPNRDFDVKSMTSGHAPYHYSNKASVCPREEAPAWYTSFFMMNRKNPLNSTP